MSFEELTIPRTTFLPVKIETGKTLAWTAEPKCPWQLAVGGEAHVYISANSLEDYIPIYTKPGGGIVFSWSACGNALYYWDRKGRLHKIHVGARDEQLGQPIDITPPDWAAYRYMPVSLWPAPSGANLYCVTVSLHGTGPSFWRVALPLRMAIPLLRNKIPGDFCPASNTALYCTKTPGIVALYDVENNAIVERRVSSRKILFAAFSRSGRRLVFSELNGEAHRFRCFDLETSDTVDLGRATFGSVSPNEDYIATVRGDYELVMINRVSGESETIAKTEYDYNEGDLPCWLPTIPQWSPDGRWLAFSLCEWRQDPVISLLKNTKPEFTFTDQSSFIFDISERTLFRLPLTSQHFAWRPTPR